MAKSKNKKEVIATKKPLEASNLFHNIMKASVNNAATTKKLNKNLKYS